MAKRVWVDRYIANKLGERLTPLLEQLFSEDYIAVVDDTAVDIRAFQDTPEWLDEQLGKTTIIAESSLQHINLLTDKPFVWFSQNNTVTEAAKSFSDAIKGFANKRDISFVNSVINGYSFNERQWKHSPNYRGAVILLDSEREILKMSKHYPSLTEVFIAAKAVHRMDMFVQFCVENADSEALWHNCEYKLSINGAEKVFIPSI